MDGVNQADNAPSIWAARPVVEPAPVSQIASTCTFAEAFNEARQEVA